MLPACLPALPEMSLKTARNVATLAIRFYSYLPRVIIIENIFKSAYILQRKTKEEQKLRSEVFSSLKF